MAAAFAAAIGDADPTQVDLTGAYHAARRRVFDTCEAVPLHLALGESALIHRFALHGTDVWDAALDSDAPQGRVIAFFRPEFTAGEWLAPDT